MLVGVGAGGPASRTRLRRPDVGWAPAEKPARANAGATLFCWRARRPQAARHSSGLQDGGNFARLLLAVTAPGGRADGPGPAWGSARPGGGTGEAGGKQLS